MEKDNDNMVCCDVDFMRKSARYISRWKNETQVSNEIASKKLFPFRVCGQCFHYDPFLSMCYYNGRTTKGSSCDFWSAEE